jgi:hypothetical protein
MIGGRNFEPSAARLSLRLDGQPWIDQPIGPGPFLNIVAASFPATAAGYSRLTIAAESGRRIAIEQFDVSTVRPVMGFGGGWHEQELDPQTGRRWRWLSEHGEIQVRAPDVRLTLHIDGESPRRYFARGSRLVIRSGDRIVFDEVLSDDFSRDVPLASPGPVVTFDTDQSYVPAERSGRTADRRRLGLRMFRVELRAQN